MNRARAKLKKNQNFNGKGKSISTYLNRACLQCSACIPLAQLNIIENEHASEHR